jgi:hypothetical protein
VHVARLLALVVLTAGCQQSIRTTFSAVPLPDGVGADVGLETLACLSAADCLPGQVCCVPGTGTSVVCQRGPCEPPSEFVNLFDGSTIRAPAIQLCATTAECLATGDVCGSRSTAVAEDPNAPLMLLTLPPDAGVCVSEAGPTDAQEGGMGAETADASGDAGDAAQTARDAAGE